MPKKLFLISLILIVSIHLLGQRSEAPINSYSYVIAKDNDIPVGELINHGIRAFTVNDERDFKLVISACENHLRSEKTVFLLIRKDKTVGEKYLKENENQFYKHQALQYPTEEKLITKNQYFVVIDNNTCIQHIDSLRENYNGYSDFIQHSPKDTTSIYKKLYEYWELNAHPINFLECYASDIHEAQTLIRRLNTHKRISGLFTLNNEPTNEVYFNQSKKHFQNSQFCLPYKYFIKLNLYKKGYTLSHQSVLAYYSTEYWFANITATPIPLNSKLICKFEAGKKDSIDNTENNTVLNNGVTIISEGNEKLFHFDAKSYMTFIPKKSDDSLLNITLAIRFRTTKANLTQSLVSQGTSYIFKIYKNKLCFTQPEKKDYYFDNLRITDNSWYNISLTITNGNQLELFHNNQLIDTCTIHTTTPSNENIIIGSSVYQENFMGEFQNIRIWNRSLSQNDINKIWLAEKSNSTLKKVVFFITTIILLIIFMGIIKSIIKKTRFNKKNIEQNLLPIKSSFTKPKAQQNNSILMFGGFSLMDDNERDITHDMYPKVKQLLLLFIIYSIEEGGVSTKELNNLMWPGMNESSAKNNRGVTIQNLRQALSQIPLLELVFSNKQWKINGIESLFVDYLEYRDIVEKIENNSTDLDHINTFLELCSQPFLQNCDMEWLDKFKNQVNERNLDILLQLANSSLYKTNSNVLLKISTAIFTIDEVNEEALKIRILAYKIDKNAAMVRISMDNFKKKYFAFYNAEFENDSIS